MIISWTCVYFLVVGREFRDKDIEKSDETRVFYRENRLYYFDQIKSGSLSIHDLVTTVNPIYMVYSLLLTTRLSWKSSI